MNMRDSHRHLPLCVLVGAICAFSVPALQAQEAARVHSDAVPTFVHFSDTLRDGSEHPVSGMVEVTFSLYKESQGGEALWMEAQKVTADQEGRFSVALGATYGKGMPATLFATAEARWLGVRIEGQEERPRVLLLSVPYALKAADAQTLGGLPVSAFALANGTSATGKGGSNPSGSVRGNGTSTVTTAGGTVNTLPLFSTSTDIENSVVTQSSGYIGINTPTPGTTLDVNGSATVRSNLAATGFVNAGSYQLGGTQFAVGDAPNSNVFIGFSGNTTSGGYSNTATGGYALNHNTLSHQNTANGTGALDTNTTGNDNAAFGAFALFYNTTASENTGDGTLALYNNTTGAANTATGYEALSSNSTGSFNTSVGDYSSYYNQSGSYNTALGISAGPAMYMTNLTNTTAIGSYAAVSTSNSMVLGSINGINGATADTNVGIATTAPIARLHIGVANTTSFRVEGPNRTGTGAFAGSFGGFGDFNVDAPGIVGGRFTVKESGRVGIGTPAPDATLSVSGTADKTGGGSWATFSDLRLKDLGDRFTPGLSQILRIQPVRYRYKAENGMGIRDTEEHVGLVAQDVRKIIPEAVSENGKGYLLVNNDPIIWAMLNAIKEQQQQIRAQQRQIRTLSGTVVGLKAALAKTAETQPVADAVRRTPVARKGRDGQTSLP